ncbi:hypothetical protein Rleg9DRAFT_0770 [Rhizobium leguminosarum bv. trifolii WSM597]|uniref:Uncharacterized protein n=1 Tax=Rhizobium leguminosarum bv. trifolii WSM597 TaxID=754764 RepID=I9N5M3_RHILT|nr:hypothetical protein Rleg9DRAFT_0770 [Rhizobium leguminosarum bv. trifolii WSM597]
MRDIAGHEFQPMFQRRGGDPLHKTGKERSDHGSHVKGIAFARH